MLSCCWIRNSPGGLGESSGFAGDGLAKASSASRSANPSLKSVRGSGGDGFAPPPNWNLVPESWSNENCSTLGNLLDSSSAVAAGILSSAANGSDVVGRT